MGSPLLLKKYKQNTFAVDIQLLKFGSHRHSQSKKPNTSRYIREHSVLEYGDIRLRVGGKR